MDDRTPEINGNGQYARAGGVEELRVLHEEIAGLVRALPGTLAGMTVRFGDVQVEITWSEGVAPAPSAIPGPGPWRAGGAAPEDDPAPPAGNVITAPLVGTFYRAPEPGAEPFVKPGDTVAVGQQIGIVEAMKLMNRVDADCAGKVVEVLVADATAVEFGQPLVRVDPGTG